MLKAILAGAAVAHTYSGLTIRLDMNHCIAELWRVQFKHDYMTHDELHAIHH